MPSGETHYKFFKAGYSISIPASIYLIGVNPTVGIGWFLGYSFGRWIDPDLDQIGITSAEGRLVNEVKIFGHILYGISSIYGSIFRHKHRSFLTHFPFISTTIRLCFLFFWLPILFYFFNWNVQWWQLYFSLGFFLGLSQADLQHFLADMFWKENHFSSEKRKRK